MTSAQPLVVPYRPEWPSKADQLIASLHRALGPLAVRIEHIGSSAIPGMAAKDTLDLQMSAADLVHAAASFDGPLEELGFQRSPYEADHVPAGLVDDPARWVKRLWVRRGHPDGDVNLHLRLIGSPNERLALLFRDWFRSHPEAVPAFAAFKTALADATPDIEIYTDVKDPVVDLIIAVAEAWAIDAEWRA